MIASGPLPAREGDAAAAVACALVRRDGSIADWSAALALFSGWSEASAKQRALSELVTALEPREMPELRAFAPGMSWSGVVALAGAEAQAPRCVLAELRHVPGRDELRLTLSPLAASAALDAAGVAPALDDFVDQQRLSLVVENMPGFVYTLDRNFVFTSSVGAGLAALNLKPNELVGVNLLEMWGVRDPGYEPLAAHLRALAGYTATYQDVCVGRSIEYRLQPLRDRAGNVVGVVSTGFDVTEREHAKEQQAKLTAQLRQAQKMEAIGRLAGGVAHDFNNLLTCIMGNLTLAEEHAASDSRLARYLEGASAAAESAATLTRQLLAFGRKQVIEPRPVNLSVLIERVQGMLERLIGESIALRTACAADLWYVQADPGQLEQVLVNLVVNARDAIAGHGEIEVETKNLETSQPGAPVPGPPQPGRYVVLSVRDTGRGMSDVVRSKLFEPFFTTKETGAGTGLGLATVYGAVQQNGGTITVDSTLGAGSTFRIFLPRIDVDFSSVRSSEPVLPPPSSRSRGGTETILVVEDEPLVLELAACTLHELGYNVVPCATADEALRRLPDYPNRIDLLLTDVVMPRMNGRELASRIASLQPGIAVLFSSGYGEDIIAKQGVLDAGLYFIGKPYRPAELAAKVRGILDTRAQKNAPAQAS